MSRPVDIARDYRKVIISRWVSQKIDSFQRPSREALRDLAKHYHPLVERLMPADRSASILEIGCGFGSFLQALSDRGYANVKAVDLIAECCDFVREHLGIQALCSDLIDFLATDDGRYDVIAAFDVIEHFTKNEIVAIMDRLHDVLNPGGLVIIRVPNGGSLAGISTRYAGFTHETAFTPLSLNELLKAMGFRNVECLPDPVGASTPLRRAVKRAAQWTFERALSAATMRVVSASFAVSQNITAVARKA